MKTIKYFGKFNYTQGEASVSIIANTERGDFRVTIVPATGRTDLLIIQGYTLGGKPILFPPSTEFWVANSQGASDAVANGPIEQNDEGWPEGAGMIQITTPTTQLSVCQLKIEVPVG